MPEMIRVMDSKRPGTKMIYKFNLDNYIPKDHFLRIVESTVDLSFVRDLVKRFCSDRGAPSVDPVVILKMSLLEYFYGISSEDLHRDLTSPDPGGRMPATLCMRVTARDSSSVSSGSTPGTALASMLFPAPGGPDSSKS